MRVNSERCLVGWGWTSGTPILPNYLYNNLKQIVQTPTEVMILTEMIHDARIVRIGGKHLPSNIRKWLGDSVGHWEGDTLVVDTVALHTSSFIEGFTPHSDAMTVKERIRFAGPDLLEDRITVTDPKALTKPWETIKSYRKAKPGNDELREFACAEGLADAK